MIEVVEIEDFTRMETSRNPFTRAVKDVDGIIHAASPLDYSVSDVENDLIRPAIEGVRMVFQAASKEPRVKRIVLTSSFASVMDDSRGPGPGFTYTGADWNPLTYEESVKSGPVIAYRGSKKFAEVEAWEIAKNATFDLVTFCPPMTFGPIAHPIDSLQELNLSNKTIYDIYMGISPLPVSRVPVWVDVRDLALAHVRGLMVDKAGGKRYVPSSREKFSYDLAAKILAQDSTANVKGEINSDNLNPNGYDLDFETAEKDLNVSFRGFSECIQDLVYQFKHMSNAIN